MPMAPEYFIYHAYADFFITHAYKRFEEFLLYYAMRFKFLE